MDLQSLLLKHRIPQHLLRKTAVALGYKLDQAYLSKVVRGELPASLRYRCGIRSALRVLKVPVKQIRAVKALTPPAEVW